MLSCQVCLTWTSPLKETWSRGTHWHPFHSPVSSGMEWLGGEQLEIFGQFHYYQPNNQPLQCPTWWVGWGGDSVQLLVKWSERALGLWHFETFSHSTVVFNCYFQLLFCYFQLFTTVSQSYPSRPASAQIQNWLVRYSSSHHSVALSVVVSFQSIKDDYPIYCHHRKEKNQILVIRS